MPKTLTIRTQPENDEAMIRVGKILGEKTAAWTLLNSQMEYECHREEIDRLREALRRMREAAGPTDAEAAKMFGLAFQAKKIKSLQTGLHLLKKWCCRYWPERTWII